MPQAIPSNNSETQTVEARCCIAGGGPAGTARYIAQQPRHFRALTYNHLVVHADDKIRSMPVCFPVRPYESNSRSCTDVSERAGRCPKFHLGALDARCDPWRHRWP